MAEVSLPLGSEAEQTRFPNQSKPQQSKEKREKNKVDVAKQHKRSLHWQKVSYYI